MVLLILNVTELPKVTTQPDKSRKAAQDEIHSVLRQTTATMTFLPQLEVSLFDLLIYTKIWLCLKSGKSWDHSSLPVLSMPICIPSLLQLTK